MARVGRTVCGAALAVVLVALSIITPPAHAASMPSLRLQVLLAHQGIERSTGDPVILEPGVLVGSSGGSFELRVHRATYDDPVQIEQVDARAHKVLRSLPPTTLDRFDGLSNFLH